MPLIILTGVPCSGKTRRAKQLATYFTNQNKTVKIISENEAVPKAGYKKNQIYADSQKEKIVRGDLKSETVRVLNKDDVLILDAGNYIKGYRYEIYCASKSVRITQCTVWCALPQNTAWEFNLTRETEENDEIVDNSNVAYSKEIFEALCMRYEEPNGNSRWDSPLFTVLSEDDLPFAAINSALFEKAAPKPNQSTQNPPLSDTNYLYEMDKITQDIVAQIISAMKIGCCGDIKIPNHGLTVAIPANVNALQLNRIRRSFLNYSKTQNTSGLEKIPKLFVQYLNSNFNSN